jgi:ABC-type transporter Mla subunit MlaD
MTLGQATHRSRTISREDLVRALFVAVAVLLVVVALVAAFGLQQTGPTYDVVTDPAGPLGF